MPSKSGVSAMYIRTFTVSCAFLLFTLTAAAQPAKVNYDESKVPAYTLPELLVTSSGETVDDAEEWESVRRPEILRLFEEHVYGKMPGRPNDLSFEVLSVDENALGGKATRKEVRVHFSKEKAVYMDLLIFLPNQVEGPAPLFVGLNFYGNHTV